MSKLPLTRVLAVFGSGTDGRLGLGFPITSQLYPRIVASLAGYSIKQVSCGGAHTAVVTGQLAVRVAGAGFTRTRGGCCVATSHACAQYSRRAAFGLMCRR